MALEITGDVGGDVTGGDKIENSEVQKSETDKAPEDIKVDGSVAGDATAGNKITESKMRTKWVLIAVAITAMLGSISAYYFAKPHPNNQTVQEVPTLKYEVRTSEDSIKID